jgi:hypothetical protein
VKAGQQAELGLVIEVRQDCGIATSGGGKLRGQHPDDDRYGHRSYEYCQEKPTCSQVTPRQDHEHEQCLPAIGDVLADHERDEPPSRRECR